MNRVVYVNAQCGDELHRRPYDLARLSARVEYYRQQGKRVVFTNGCFDILPAIRHG